MPMLTQGRRRVQALGIFLALLNVLLWLCAPMIRKFFDAMTAAQQSFGDTVLIRGVQELLVYFDPWLALVVLPVVYTAGFALLPFLIKPPSGHAGSGLASSVAVTIVLLSFEMLWLILIAIGVFLRGPDWNFYWPWEPRIPKVVPMNNVNLSDIFWIRWTTPPYEEMSWAERELPGLLLIGGYFLAGFVIAGLLYRKTPGATAYWRWLAFVLIVQLAALVPMKVFLRWEFNMKYIIYVPELGLNV